MFERDKLYKHDRNRDVAIAFQGVAGEDEEAISIIVDWYNIVHEPFCVKRYKVVRITKVELPNWKPFTGDRGTYGKSPLLFTLPSRGQSAS